MKIKIKKASIFIVILALVSAVWGSARLYKGQLTIISNTKTSPTSISVEKLADLPPYASILIDASRDGGAWWFPQAGPFDSARPHQGKALADYLKSLGYSVRELPRPFTIEYQLLREYDLVIRTGESGNSPIYTNPERDAYRKYVYDGGKLVLLEDYFWPGTQNELSSVFGLKFSGMTRGNQGVNFIRHQITAGTPQGIPFIVGSAVIDYPNGTQILANLDSNSYLDLDNNIIQDRNEPSAPPVMGILRFGAGKIFFVSDINYFEIIVLPLTKNVLRWILSP